MIKRLAVIIVGELRTWEHVHPYTFNFFQERAIQVDYFFVTWNVDTSLGDFKLVTKDQVVKPFKSKYQNLVDYMIVDTIGIQRTTFYNLAWLSKIGNVMKRRAEQEGDFVYDQVVETRPDIYLRKQSNLGFKWPECTNYTYWGVGVPFDSPSHPGFLALHDVYYRTNSFTNDILANRYSFKQEPEHFNISFFTNFCQYDHHGVIIQYFLKNNLRPMLLEDKKANEDCYLDRDFQWEISIRPNVPPDTDLDLASCDSLKKYSQEWNRKQDFYMNGFGSAPTRLPEEVKK